MKSRQNYSHAFALLGGLLLLGGAARADDASTKDALVRMEKNSWVAWQNHDGKFFESFLSDDHVEVGTGGPTNKSDVVAGVAGGACVVKSYSLGKFSFTQFGPDTGLLTYWADQDTSCAGQKVPTPVWTSSLYMKRNGRWVNALYQHTQIPRS